MHSVALGLRPIAAGFRNSKHQVGSDRDQGHVTSVTWLFDWPWAISYRCYIGTDTRSPKDFEILRLKCIWVTVLTFLGHVTSSVTWSFFRSMWCPTSVPLTPTRYLELFARSLKISGCQWSRNLYLQGHETSSVTWPFYWPWAICYRCSISTDTLSPKDFELLKLKCTWVTVLTFLGRVTSSVTCCGFL